MDSIITLFKCIDYPIWIKDDKNKIMFMNDMFKDNFIFNNKESLENSEINEFLNEIKSINKKATQLIRLNDKLYKHIISLDNENRVIGMLIDLSDVIETSNLQCEKNILKTVLDNIPELIFYKDLNLKYMGINKEFETFYANMGVEDIIGKTDEDLPIDKSFAAKYYCQDKLVIERKETLNIEETVDDNTFETIKTPIIGDNGKVEGILGIVKNVTDYKKKERILNQLCYTDALTNLFNRTYFDEKISELLEAKCFPIGIIIGDINDLKIVNDTLGHIEGDQLLIKMSQILLDNCNDAGNIFRWGGDEFVILLPNCTDLQCTSLMNNIDKSCNNINLSISQGYSILNENGSIDKVLAEAEDKVYKQKMLSENTIRASILDTLRMNLANKNVETEQHTERVSNYCVEICKALNLEQDMIEKSAIVGKLHDIGKIGIADHILLKQGKLSDEEYEAIKTHSEKGYRLASLLPELSPISREILTHHERWDGRGYPLGLQGEEIPILSRIVFVADSFDAMTEDRCYRKGRSIEEAVTEIKRCSGTQFDPDVVEVFINIIDKIKELSFV